ncbi:MAG TPA: outer membrane beta-barrel protein [Hyphomicrobium sp.]
MATSGLFENPPAGYDPLLFQIEDLNPYTDNRTTRRLFRQEPYDPVGIKVGSFVLFPELEFGTSYYSNVFHAPGSPSDWAMDVKPAARFQTGARMRSSSERLAC